MYLLVVSLLIGYCLCSTIDLQKSGYLCRSILCKENELCKLENCDQVERVVQEKQEGKGTRFHPPDDTGGWICQQPRKVFINVFCAYGVYYKYVNKTITEHRSNQCKMSPADILTFNSIDSIQLDLEQSLKCQISEEQKDFKNYLCKGIEFQALFNIIESCGNQVTNIISKDYQLEFTFDLIKEGDYQYSDIDTVSYKLTNTKSELVKTSFHDYEINTTNIEFKQLLQRSEFILAKNIMNQISAHIEKQES